MLDLKYQHSEVMLGYEILHRMLYRINPGIQFSFTMLINYSASLKMRYHILKRLMSLTSNAGSTKECGIDFILDIFCVGDGLSLKGVNQVCFMPSFPR